MRVTFEGNDRGLVSVRTDDFFDERPRRRFLVRQRALFGDTDVDHKSDGQRTISLALKSEHRLRRAVFEYADIALLQIGDVAIVLVGRSEQQVGEIGFGADYINVLIRRRRGLGFLALAGRTKKEKSNAN